MILSFSYSPKGSSCNSSLHIVLKIFAKLSSLKINLEKSELLITSATDQEILNLAQSMECKAAKFPITYLGMPLSNKRLTKAHYEPLINKVLSKLTNWRASMLSIIQLLNSVLSAIPVYMMQTFILLK